MDSDGVRITYRLHEGTCYTLAANMGRGATYDCLDQSVSFKKVEAYLVNHAKCTFDSGLPRARIRSYPNLSMIPPETGSKNEEIPYVAFQYKSM